MSRLLGEELWLGLIATMLCMTLLELREHECLWSKEFEQETPALEQND